LRSSASTAPPGVDGEILDELAVQGIVACEGTASPSMEWDTCALALARSHERLRADRSQLIATLMKEREERLLPGSPADAADVARRLVEDFASAYRCDACNARASMPDHKPACNNLFQQYINALQHRATFVL
jgi:hypothetical protein